jgi:hypothetical protein
VFGVSSDEYLNYAPEESSKWEDRGLEVVAGLYQAKLLSEKKAVPVEAAPPLCRGHSRSDRFFKN